MNEPKRAPLPWKVTDEYQTEDVNTTYHVAIKDAEGKLVLAIQQVTADAGEQMRAIRAVVAAVNASLQVEAAIRVARAAEYWRQSQREGTLRADEWQTLLSKLYAIEATLAEEAWPYRRI